MFHELTATIRKVRHLQGATQAQLAERLGVTQQLVSRLERGKGSLKQLVRLCRGLGLPVRLQVGELSVVLVHGLDPDERREIEANIDWFSRLPALERLRAIRRHVHAVERLRKAAVRGG